MADPLLARGRQALQQGKVEAAIQLLSAASAQQPRSPDVWFALGTALARKGGEPASCCMCYLRTMQLLSGAGKEQLQTPAAQAMAAVAADNCWLLATQLLPTAWPAAARDSAAQAAVLAGVDHALRQLLHQPHVQLVCVGGLGIEAMQAAVAASQVQQAGGNGVPTMALACIPSDRLAAHLATQLLADNGLDEAVDVCSWQELWAQQQGDAALLALLAGAVQPNWAPAVAACLKACQQLAHNSSSSSTCSLVPGCLRVVAVPVACADLLALNEVDLPGMAAHTAGAYRYAAANAALRRSSRPAQVSRFQPQLLAQPAVVLELHLQQLLQQCRRQQQQQHEAPTAAAAAPAVAAALAAGAAATTAVSVTVQQAGRVDCLVWWLEFEHAPGCVASFAPPAAACSRNSRSSPTPDVLRPHAWQQVQYLPPSQQGLHLDAGQRLQLQVVASAAELQLAIVEPASAAVEAGLGAVSLGAAPAGRVTKQAAGSSDQPGREILPYHLSMLNDHSRTRAYDAGIAGAVQALLLHQQQQQQQPDGSLQGSTSSSTLPPVVLDVGCGTGLLSMMAATAAAGAGGSVRVTGCEREPVLARVAQQLVADNGLQAHISIVQKLSSELSVAAAAADGQPAQQQPRKGAAAAAAAKGKQQQAAPAELPARAALVVHEIFGTDPLSEHVLPALRQVQQQLAAPGARFLPARLRVVAAVALCPALLHTRLGGEEASQWHLSSLLPLQPRKAELQLVDLQAELLLLTRPQPVLEMDFEQPLQLNGKAQVQLPALAQPVGLRLRDWLQQQQQQGVTTSSDDGNAAASGGCNGAGDVLASPPIDALCVVSWFEADCGEGGWLSTAPGTTHLGHWQQSVEFVGGASSGALLAGGCYSLQVAWSVDRLRFSLL